MSNETDIPLLKDLIRSGDDLKHDSETSEDSNGDLDIGFISEQELSDIEHSAPIRHHPIHQEPSANETPLFEAIRNEAFANLEITEESVSVETLPDDLHVEDPVPMHQTEPDSSIKPAAGIEQKKKEPEMYKEDFSNVRELLLDEEIHLILDRHMEHAYQEITQLIKKRT